MTFLIKVCKTKHGYNITIHWSDLLGFLKATTKMIFNELLIPKFVLHTVQTQL